MIFGFVKDVALELLLGFRLRFRLMFRFRFRIKVRVTLMVRVRFSVGSRVEVKDSISVENWLPSNSYWTMFSKTSFFCIFNVGKNAPSSDSRLLKSIYSEYEFSIH